MRVLPRVCDERKGTMLIVEKLMLELLIFLRQNDVLTFQVYKDFVFIFLSSLI